MFASLTYVDPWQGTLPTTNLLLFKGFDVSKNWQCHGKILGLLLFVYFISKWKESSENCPFAILEESNTFLYTIWFGNSLKTWHLKTTKNQTSKHSIWNFRQNLETKLKSWGSLCNFLWNSMVPCKLHLCRSMVGNLASYNPIAVQMLPSLKELTMLWYNFGFAFFVYFVSKSRETSGKWSFCTFGRKQCLCLIHLARELAFKNNKNRNFKILYLNC